MCWRKCCRRDRSARPEPAPLSFLDRRKSFARRSASSLFATPHGLLLGRQADLVTEARRASALEMLGYRVDVIEFVSAEHTAKNLMLRAEREPSASRADRAAAEYVELRDRWGVAPAIERLLGERLPVSPRA